jgi:3-hydroxyacyl-CoA dehydrogenase / enoyl-CoA hydratase / 3-hydroxybutyryl-CoA epimerase
MEGIRLLLDGVPADVVDSAAKAVAFPVGPLQAHDEASLDLVIKASITQVADNVMADRLDVATIRVTLERLLDAGILGRRHGTGFYTYEDGRRRGTNPEVTRILGVAPSTLTARDAGERLLLAFATECLLCWDDGTLCHPDDADVASVLGIGFPRILGGPFHWIDETGLGVVLAQCASRGPVEFPIGVTLPELAIGGGRFHDLERRDTPVKTGL